MDIIGLISNAFSAFAGWLGFSKQKDAEMNTDLMRANKTAEIDLKQHDENVKEVLDGDLDALRKHRVD